MKKYLSVLEARPSIKAIVVYDESQLPILPPEHKSKVFLWRQFLALGANPKEGIPDIKKLMNQQQPGNCCTIVYTSGTTGPPKGVLLSHDNYIYNVKYLLSKVDLKGIDRRLLSYLPLSHVAGQTADIVGPIIVGGHVYFADSTALQGKLVDYLK